MRNQTTFDFPVSKNVGRHVIVVAQPQVIGAERQKVQLAPRKKREGVRVPVVVEAVRFRRPTTKPPTDKLRKVIEFVIEIVVHPVDNPKTLLYGFNPPLQMTIELAPDDLENALPDSKGNPSLFIFRCYQDGSDKWIWAKLPTRLTKIDGKPALSTAITTLYPDDPFGEGSA